MKKIYFYLVVLSLTLTFCNSPEAKKTYKSDRIVSSDTINTTKQEQSLRKKEVISSDPIRKDTSINKYHISYYIQDNDDIIKTFPIVYGKGSDTVYYAEREVLLNIEYLKDNILHKKINKDFFKSYIPKEEIGKYHISYFNLDSVNKNETIFFNIVLCMPDTDICYWFELSISNKGDIEIEEIYEDEDM
jgi:phosphoribosylaminoimidazolecarboxamide formyltransferase/IMP cyclohydrolase